MDLKRLFGVLVLGGAALGCDDVIAPGEDAALADAALADAALADTAVAIDGGAIDTGAMDAGPGNDAGTEGGVAFCPTEEACDGETVQPGFECCWGTSC